jgi:hypothetical protein
MERNLIRERTKAALMHQAAQGRLRALCGSGLSIREVAAAMNAAAGCLVLP